MAKRQSLSKRILLFMGKCPSEQYNAVTIDRFLYKKNDYVKKLRKKNIHSIRKELDRLVKRGKVMPHAKGMYSIRLTPKNLCILEDPPLTFHGMKFELNVLKSVLPQKGAHGPPRMNPQKASQKALFGESEMLENWLVNKSFAPHQNNKSRYKGIWWEGRDITITVHECGLIEIYIGCNDNPMDFMLLVRFNEWLHGYMHGVADFSVMMVRQFAANKDFKFISLEGITNITMKQFMNTVSRIYYKREIHATRIEQHMVFEKNQLPFETALWMIATVNSPQQFHKLVKGQSKIDNWSDDLMFG